MAIHQPHDHLFKRVFGVPADAASFLQARLPARLSRALHWPTLKREYIMETGPENTPESFAPVARRATARVGSGKR